MATESFLETTTNIVSGSTDSDNTDTDDSTNYVEMYLTIMKMVIGVFGIIGNFTVCLAVKQMRTNEVKFLIGSQAAIDMLTSLVLVTGTVTSRWWFTQLVSPKSHALGYMYCMFWHWDGLLFYLFSMSTYNLIAISIERYLTVMHPIWYRTNFSRNKAIILGAMLWTAGPVMQIILCVLQTYYIDGYCHWVSLSPVGQAVIGVLIFCWDFFGPCIIMGFCFTRISLELVKQDRRAKFLQADTTKGVSTVSNNYKVGDEGKNSGKEASAGKSRSRNVTQTFLTVFVAFVICWITNQLLYLQLNLGGIPYHGTWANHFANGMAVLNSTINPFIYVFRYKQYREKMKSLFCIGSVTDKLGPRSEMATDTTNG